MNNFIFENATKVYFGQGCTKEYLSSLINQYGNTAVSYTHLDVYKRQGKNIVGQHNTRFISCEQAIIFAVLDGNAYPVAVRIGKMCIRDRI